MDSKNQGRMLVVVVKDREIERRVRQLLMDPNLSAGDAQYIRHGVLGAVEITSSTKLPIGGE
jgi:hypothetical protein